MKDWRDDAACKGMGTDLFYPEPGDMASVEQAKAICAGCKVREQCYVAANVPVVDRYGIWGGMTRHQRALRRKKERKAGMWAESPTGRPRGYEADWAQMDQEEDSLPDG